MELEGCILCCCSATTCCMMSTLVHCLICEVAITVLLTVYDVCELCAGTLVPAGSLYDVCELCAGTLVPAGSLAALHQLLSHDSNKNKSQVVVSGGTSSHDQLHITPARSQMSVTASSGGGLPSTLPAPLTSSSAEQLHRDQRTDSWPTSAKHLSMPSLVEFL